MTSRTSSPTSLSIASCSLAPHPSTSSSSSCSCVAKQPVVTLYEAAQPEASSCAICFEIISASLYAFSCSTHRYCIRCTHSLLKVEAPCCPLCRAPAIALPVLVESAAKSWRRTLRPLLLNLPEHEPQELIRAVMSWADTDEQAACLRELGWAGVVDVSLLHVHVVHSLEDWEAYDTAASLLQKLGVTLPALIGALEGWCEKGAAAAALVDEWMMTQPYAEDSDVDGLRMWSELSIEVVAALEGWDSITSVASLLEALTTAPHELVSGLRRWRNHTTAMAVLKLCCGGDAKAARDEWRHPGGIYPGWWLRGDGWRVRWDLWRSSRCDGKSGAHKYGAADALRTEA